jgi:SpoVK/Ycf46/Vps4 family AAA+-type ATPase
MGEESAVIGAIEAALAAEPRNVVLRVHLAELLVGAGEPTRALEHAQLALAQSPTDPEALRVAGLAARLAGELKLAADYEQIAAAVRARLPQPGEDPGPHGSELDVELEALVRNAAEDALEVEKPELMLADVGGMEEVKREVERTFLAPMRHPELRKMYRKSLRGGLLLFGPPGCGKTYLARAIAGELGAGFQSVGLHEVLDMWVGQSEKNIHDAFERARRCAPCVLFLDEVDALGQKRSNLARSAVRNAVVQLLSELDGVDDVNEGLFVLGATNQPWDVDPALRRPGRFDRTLLVMPPDRAARARIFEVHLRGRPVGAVDVDRLARRTEGYSGADVRLACETAAEYAIEDSLATGRVREITATDLERAIASITPSTRAWFEVARNFVTFANASGEYDRLLEYMRSHKLL